MTKQILASMTALALIIAPVAAMAQTNGDAGTAAGSEKMKGPPNADGMQKNDSSSNGMTPNGMTSGRSEDSNGAAAAKATGADKGK